MACGQVGAEAKGGAVSPSAPRRVAIGGGCASVPSGAEVVQIPGRELLAIRLSAGKELLYCCANPAPATAVVTASGSPGSPMK